MFFDCKSIEDIIGYTFKNKSLLQTAFTHPTFVNENVGYQDYDRLEFLGDSCLGFIISEYLFDKYPNYSEAKLTKLKQFYVSTKPLANCFFKLSLDKYILVGKGVKNIPDSVLENVFESTVASIYLDGGIEKVKDFVYKTLIPSVDLTKYHDDYKSLFYEYVAKNKLGTCKVKPLDDIIENDKQIFVQGAYLNDKLLYLGKGIHPKDAEDDASKNALKILGGEVN